MRTNKILLSVIALLSMCFLISCEKDSDDNSIRFYKVVSVTAGGEETLEEISGVEVNIGWSAGFYVTGGTGDYNIRLYPDQSIEVNPDPDRKDYYIITSKEIGYSSIYITDSNGDQATLPASVSSYTRSEYVRTVVNIIIVEECNIDGLELTLAQYIDLILSKRSADILGKTFQFHYDRPKAGSLTVTGSEGQYESGTFEYLQMEDYDTLVMEYGNQTYTYIHDVDFLAKSGLAKSVGPIYDQWVLDFTEEFREKFPDRRVQEVSCVVIFQRR